jgi:hypothetical protein
MVLQESDDFLVYPVIVMRTGGLDGVALQAREYRHLLNSMDIGVHVMTGRCETKFTTVNPIGHQQTTISRLDFYHKDSRLLFANQFENGSETEEGIEQLTKEEWIELFHNHKTKIKKRIMKVLGKIEHQTPVLIYNLVSLRHAHPAAAAALKEIIIENPDRAFLSHSADPDAERPEKIDRIKDYILPFISANNVFEDYSGGPLTLDNLYHIVLNPTQRDNFINRYNIPENHVFEIPDFLDFISKEPAVRLAPTKIFMNFLRNHQVKIKGKSYTYNKGAINKDTVIFLSPVRPVYRKRLKEAMLMAKAYGVSRDRDVAFVVTHPNIDDKKYFLETLKFAKLIDLPYYHLGKTFTIDTLDSVYENLATLKTIGVVASSAGGWENALNEMARACIPFYMNSTLNSFKPLTEEIGIKTLGIDFAAVDPYVTEIENSKSYDLSNAENHHPIVQDIFTWFDKMLLSRSSRGKLMEHNYHCAYNYLSHDATLPRLVKCINYIYHRHGTPGKTVKATTLTKLTHEF